MTKEVKYIFKSTLLFVVSVSTSLFLASCKDDVKYIEVAENPIYPAGIVMMAHPSEVVNGDTAEVLFRLNPSLATLTQEQLAIDCVYSNIYTLKEEEQDSTSDTRASYVQNSSNYTLVGLQQETQQGDTLQGQWRAKILVKTDKNIFDKSTLALVATYKDKDGKENQVSSDPFNMDLVPTPDDGVKAWAPTLYTDSTKINGNQEKATAYYWIAEENMYQNASGAYVVYDMDKRIRSVRHSLGTLDNDTTTTEQETQTVDISGKKLRLYSFLPDATKEPFCDLLIGKQNSYTAPSILTLTDKTGHEAFKSVNSHYSHFRRIELEVDCPKQLKAGETYSIDLEKTLADFGYSAEEFNIDIISRELGVSMGKYNGVMKYSVLYDWSEDNKTVNIKVYQDCDADETFPCLKGFTMGSKLNWDYPNSLPISLWKVLLTFKRKGA